MSGDNRMVVWWRFVIPNRSSALAIVGLCAALLLPLLTSIVLLGMASAGEYCPCYEKSSLADADLILGEFEGIPAIAWTSGAGKLSSGEYSARTTYLGPTPNLTFVQVANFHIADVTGILVSPDDILFSGGLTRSNEGEPLRGPDGFEKEALEELQVVLRLSFLASIPGVAVLVYFLCVDELNSKKHLTEFAKRFGKPWFARRILLIRVGGMLGFAYFVAMTIAVFAGKYYFQVPVRPNLVPLALSGLVPTMVGLLLGTIVILLGPRKMRLLDVVAKLPLALRPIALGSSGMAAIFLVCLLFFVQIGIPVSISEIPSRAIADDSEWVLGAEPEALFAGTIDTSRVDAKRLDPEISQIVSEVLVPTLIEGKPILLRGGNWADWSNYFDAALISGDTSGIVLGQGRENQFTLGDPVRIAGRSSGLFAQTHVSGFYSAPGLLSDEGWMPLPMAQELNGLKPNQASLVRIQPSTEAALDAYQSNSGVLRVTNLQLTRNSNLPGLVDVQITAINPSSATVALDAPIRVDQHIAGQFKASLAPFEVQVLSTSVLAPSGAKIEVNPDQQSPGGARFVAVSSNQEVTGVPEGTNVTIVNLQSAQSSERIIKSGKIDPLMPFGRYRLDSSFGSSEFSVLSPAGGIIATGHYVRPIQLVSGQPLTIGLELWNSGTMEGNYSFELKTEKTPYREESITLQPGEFLTREYKFTTPEARTISIDGVSFKIGGVKSTASGSVDLENPFKPKAEPSSTIQVQVADRVLGNANQALAGVAAVALTTIITSLAIVIRVNLERRRGVLATLNRLGEDSADLRTRVASEAAVMTLVAAGLALGVSTLIFIVIRAVMDPIAFGHRLPVPSDPIVLAQAAMLLIATSWVTVYVASKPYGGKA